MTEFEYDFIHDLVNKLTTISGKTKKLKKVLTSEELEILLQIEEANKEAQKLVQDYGNSLDK
ncbi:MAG: hypothetical protein BM556_12700 [Bacteriovorax sp. MedPE-SWde]|nr:MAG: hypothetical protein BM556_12700 [Bacteriovorax sp. MedPE-SWde]